jgi:hypothetical protein
MLLVRTIFHALLLLTAVVIVDTLTSNVAGVQLVLGLVRTGHFFLFAFSAAAALNRQRLLVPLVLAVAILVCYPMPMETLVRIIVTTTIGIVTGTALRGLITEGTPHAPTPQPRTDPERRPPTDPHQRPGG